MPADEFCEQLSKYFDEFQKALATNTGDWVIKGFIDVYRNVYTISIDTKVISKIIELMIFPLIARFGELNEYKIVLCEYQNHYPDITFISKNNKKIALDLKSTYRIGDNQVNGFTLGAFTGYFRNRGSTKNITFAYNEYEAHVVLGIIYSRTKEIIDEQKIHSIEEIDDIVSVVKDFTFLVQEKWKIAGYNPGSGNTKNIGSIKKIVDLVKGNGPFVPYGKKIFDDYWMNYLTQDMANAIDSVIPYSNLEEYLKWKGLSK
jgi:hypothetical protein